MNWLVLKLLRHQPSSKDKKLLPQLTIGFKQESLTLMISRRRKSTLMIRMKIAWRIKWMINTTKRSCQRKRTTLFKKNKMKKIRILRDKTNQKKLLKNQKQKIRGKKFKLHQVKYTCHHWISMKRKFLLILSRISFIWKTI